MTTTSGQGALRRVFLPSSARATIEALPPSERMAVETQLENLAMLTAETELLATLSQFEERDGRRVTDVQHIRIHFTVDPSTRVIFVHRVEQTGAR